MLEARKDMRGEIGYRRLDLLGSGRERGRFRAHEVPAL